MPIKTRSGNFEDQPKPEARGPVAAPGLPAPNAEDMFSDEREGAAPLDLL